MSASDAAPLPRLGEVFFDVRGESRTMRLSWYADTGVAVFSIWQGGTCTGTFRLPIPDLPRMVEALQRGPAPSSRPDLLDGDIETGQSPAAAHLPAAGPDVTGYQAEPPPPGGSGYPAGLAEPAVEFTAERGPRHSRPSGGHRAPEPTGYPEDLEPYPGEPGGAGYAGEPADGYLSDDTLLTPGYPGDYGHEGEPGYPDEPDDYRRYPGEPPATEYDSPVRPYVTDTGDSDEPFAEDPPERRQPRGRRRAGPPPESFPYGPPSAGDEPRQRGHYPGRH